MARTALQGLRGLGVLLALDDFGTGYSSLSYLAELPFDIVKIDQSFVAAIGQGRRVDALLVGILGLCDALELVTVAEGIERRSSSIGSSSSSARSARASFLPDRFHRPHSPRCWPRRARRNGVRPMPAPRLGGSSRRASPQQPDRDAGRARAASMQDRA